MAIGLASMFGFKYKENFNYPYISKNMTEFWRRWHISLSTWFRDYLYIPLGGNRRGNVYVNLIIVFFVTGLWHGAAWNFVVWGLWHGAFLLIERILKKSKIDIGVHWFITWAYSMLVVVVGWVLFRAPSLDYAGNYLKVMFGILKPYDVGYSVWFYLNPMVITMLIIACIASMPVWEYIEKYIGVKEKNLGFRLFIQNAYVAVLLIVSIMFLATTTYNPFIYFRF